MLWRFFVYFLVVFGFSGRYSWNHGGSVLRSFIKAVFNRFCLFLILPGMVLFLFDVCFAFHLINISFFLSSMIFLNISYKNVVESHLTPPTAYTHENTAYTCKNHFKLFPLNRTSFYSPHQSLVVSMSFWLSGYVVDHCSSQLQWEA